MTLRQAQRDRIDFPPGTVWLVGAGPGDPELLTRKAERLIGAASVIFHDALVGPGVLALAPPAARVGEELDLDWQALADPAATLAVYMGKAAAAEVSRGLLGAGLPADTPVALVENASLPQERRIGTRLDLLPLAAQAGLGSGPAILLIGAATRMDAESAGAAHRVAAAQAT